MERRATGAGRWGGLARFLVLYAALYGAYGVLSPVLPGFLAARGLTPGEIGLLLAAAGALRLAVGPLAGAFADRHRAGRSVLAASLALAGLSALAHLPGTGLAQLIGPALLYAAGTAAPAPLADALALAAARGGAAFQYGWVRGAGSAAFIVGTAAAGWLIGLHGFAAALLASGGLFLAAGAAALALPAGPGGEAGARWRGFAALVALPRFRRTVLVAALVIGAHAMHDGFAMILWRSAGIAATTAGLLWSVSVAAEVLVFLLVGPPLLARIGPATGIAVAACAGGLRWAVLASTTALPWLAAAESLHGLSFALLHLACLSLIEASTPADLRTTALALYGTLGLGLSGVAATLASGALYGAFGASAFWAMAALSLAALPLVPALRDR
ncbi:MFS transporter, PPP family, 3-phenylpropionic acid transporter [Methylobacterium sp. 275MFSha3.1]|uniref:MFS transporter n=1 Tax=Methylobacterium sp. 275MFSha3.1 TaxID=1502746 RepID=UPI0008A74BA2|nr:MFS transporter [Methylobacterium sp. 275MFSha3.1]SEH76512.1 MFS transporter, PPP family, 3-phenylpropionic acid transporter [Methylobacterium sp. 275MFSha3.1]